MSMSNPTPTERRIVLMPPDAIGAEIDQLRAERDEALTEGRKVEVLWKQATIDRDVALRDLARAMQERIDYAVRERDAARALLQEAQQCVEFCYRVGCDVSSLLTRIAALLAQEGGR